MRSRHGWMVAMLAIVAVGITAAQRNDNTAVLKGTAAFGDWREDKPGVRRLLTPQDLPAPMLTPSAANFSEIAPMPSGAKPIVPAGFTVEMIASGVKNPRVVRVAPNGDLFVADSGTIWRVSLPGERFGEAGDHRPLQAATARARAGTGGTPGRGSRNSPRGRRRSACSQRSRAGRSAEGRLPRIGRDRFGDPCPRFAPRSGGSKTGRTAFASSTASRSTRSVSKRCRGRHTASSTSRSWKRAPALGHPRCSRCGQRLVQRRRAAPAQKIQVEIIRVQPAKARLAGRNRATSRRMLRQNLLTRKIRGADRQAPRRRAPPPRLPRTSPRCR